MKVWIFALLSVFGPSAFGQEAYYGAFKIGMGSVFGNDLIESDPQLTYGGSAGVLLANNMTVGLSINYYAAKFANSTLGGDVEYSLFPILADVAYFLSEPNAGHSIYVGGLVGVTNSRLEVPGVDASKKTDLSLGVKGGVLFNVAQNFSLSPEVSMLYVFLDGEDIHFWNGQLVLTRWF